MKPEMIWQLMRRDMAWRAAPWVTLAVASFCTIWHFFAPADRDGIPTIFLFEVMFGLLIAGLVTAFSQNADTNFQATLPVTVRQVFLSRVLSNLAMMGLPVLAGLAMLAILRDPVTSDIPLGAVVPSECIVLGLQCAVIRHRNFPPWLIIIALPVWIFITAIAGVGGLLQGGSVAAAIARTVCSLIIAAVVWRTWQVIPLSFQDAPLARISHAE